MSIVEKLKSADPRTIICCLLGTAYVIVAVLAVCQGYVREVLASVTTFISVIVGYYFGSKTIETWEEE